jgi:hypothetical protein
MNMTRKFGLLAAMSMLALLVASGNASALDKPATCDTDTPATCSGGGGGGSDGGGGGGNPDGCPFNTVWDFGMCYAAVAQKALDDTETHVLTAGGGLIASLPQTLAGMEKTVTDAADSVECFIGGPVCSLPP